MPLIENPAAAGTAHGVRFSDKEVSLYHGLSEPGQAALAYAAQGWLVFPCSPTDKTPLIRNGFKAASRDPDQIRSWWRQWPKALIGVPTGPTTGFVIDLDIGDPAVITGDEYLARFEEHVGGLPPTAIAATGSGGYHLWFAWDPAHPVTNGANVVPALHIPPAAGGVSQSGKKPKGAQVDVRGEGGYVIVPPSVRGDGGRYTWCPDPEEGIAPATERLLQIALKAEARSNAHDSSPSSSVEPNSHDEALRRYAIAALDAEVQALATTQAGGRNDRLNTAAFNSGQLVGAGVLSESTVRAALEDACHRNGLVRDDGLKTVRDTLQSGLTKGIAKPRDLSTIRARSSRRSKPRSTTEHIFEHSGSGEGQHWLQLCMTNDKGEPLPNLANVMLALRSDPATRDLLAYDEMLRTPMLIHPVPVWGQRSEPARFSSPRPVTDTDIGQLQEWIQHAGLRRLNKDTAHQAADMRAVECSYHPVRDYLAALEWDGTPRLGTWLSTYLAAPQTPYETAIGTMFMIALVARIFEPGCKADYMLVLEGTQSAGKSTACSILAGEWFSDCMPDVTEGKDVMQHLAGKWLIEVAEMSALSKADDKALKAFISRAVDRYRPSYGRKEIIQPRQCLFIGTTNKKVYLRDETGGRRYWPVACGNLVDTVGLAEVRDQLFAEAVKLYHEGAHWWPDRSFEREFIAPQQEARYEADVWEEMISSYLLDKSRVTIGEVAREGLNIETPRIGTSDQRRISAALERLGWQRCKMDWKGRIPWERAQ